MRKLLALSAMLAVAGCATGPDVPTVTSRPMDATGLERVMGRTAAQLVSLMGEAAQDFRENGARKLQFTGDACILDTYLYPGSGGSEPVVTYVDARNLTGEDVDRAACVEALAR